MSESRPDLVPPCCAACAAAGVAEVTYDGGWTARHGNTRYTAASGVEAMHALQHMHYAPPEPAAAEAVTANVPHILDVSAFADAPVWDEDHHG